MEIGEFKVKTCTTKMKARGGEYVDVEYSGNVRGEELRMMEWGFIKV